MPDMSPNGEQQPDRPSHPPARPAIVITPAALGTIMVAAWGEYPHAAWGLLAARGGQLVRTLHAASLPADAPCLCTNIPDQLQRHDPDELSSGEPAGAAIYHTHLQGPAIPAGNLQQQQPLEELPHLIVSLANPDEPELRAWTSLHRHPVELELVLTNHVSATAG